MPDDRWTVGKCLSEPRLPKRNGPVHSRTIEANSQKPAARGRSIQIDAGLVVQTLHVELQQVVGARQVAGLVATKSVRKKRDREAQAPGIAAVEGRQVARHRDRKVTDMDGSLAPRGSLGSVQEPDQVRLGEAALTPASHAMTGEQPSMPPGMDRCMADPEELSRLGRVQQPLIR